jgi:hypothetical protein
MIPFDKTRFVMNIKIYSTAVAATLYSVAAFEYFAASMPINWTLLVWGTLVALLALTAYLKERAFRRES